MTYFNFIVFLSLGSLIFNSCSNVSNNEQRVNASIGGLSMNQTERISGEVPLTVSRYYEWLKQQQGITYDIKENEKITLSLLYKPLNYEAAISGGITSQVELEKAKGLKKDFHYLLIECLDKNKSLTVKTDKKELFNQLKENFFVVRNATDTVHNVIFEFFPSQLLNQPHKVLVLVPREDKETIFRAGIRTEIFRLPDINIKISEDELTSFPEVKI